MFSFIYNYLLINLIILEFIILSALIIIYYIFIFDNLIINSLYYICIVVCESVINLTLLICLVLNYGKDCLLITNLILW